MSFVIVRRTPPYSRLNYVLPFLTSASGARLAGTFMRYISFPLLLATAICASTSQGQEPSGSIADAVRKATEERRFRESDNLGSRAERAPFREIGGDGSVLVGFEVSLSKWFDSEIPHAIRPIYRQGTKEWTGGMAGQMSGAEIRRTVRITAKPGYAVGGMWIRTGAGMDRLCLHYMRIVDGHLDVDDNYSSDWVGTSDGGSDTYLAGGGEPVVGVVADATQKQARNIGFIYARVPVPARKKDPPKNSTPQAAQPAPEPVAAQSVDGGKSQLARDADAQKAEEVRDDFSWWLVLVLLAAVGAPMLLVGFLIFGHNESSQPIHPDERAAPAPRPKKPEAAAQPVADRPGLKARIEPDSPATSGPLLGLKPGEAPPYFMVRATYKAKHHRMARIYVLADELLVIDAGPGADFSQVAGVTAAVLTGGGLLGSLIGGAVGSMVADEQKSGGEAFQRKLDRLSLAGLLEWSTEEGNFRARFDELVGVSIDPAYKNSMWQEKGRAVGTFRFRHLRRGAYSFEFLAPVEIRGAIELLVRAMGNAVHIGKDWDDITASYLKNL